MSRYRILFFFIAVTIASSPSIAQSVLAEGEWYKYAIAKEGVYKLTYNDLVSAGIQVSSINPKKIKIYGNKGGMLPQPNAIDRDVDLLENEIHVVGEADGKFDPQDYILFYAYGPDEATYDEETGMFFYHQNNYSRKNFYFLTTTGTDGKRISEKDDLGHNFQKITTHSDYYHLEEESMSILNSGREWYGFLGPGKSKKINIPFENLLAGGKTKVYAEVMGQSQLQTEFEVQAADIKIGSLFTAPIADYNIDANRYAIKGKEASGIFEIDNSFLINYPTVSINAVFKDGATIKNGFIDKVLIQSDVSLTFEGASNIFNIPASKDFGVATYEITSATSQLMIWDIDGRRIYNQKFNLNSGKLLFGDIAGKIKKYVLFDSQKITSPEFIGRIENQDIKSLNSIDFLIIAPSQFMAGAEKLANFRASHDGLSVAVVDVVKIYNEFSSGRQDVTAIRDFIKHIYDKNPGKLKYVLLTGKGSYDYLDITSNNSNFIPTYQSFNSLAPLSTYSSDDYYGFLEAHEGLWAETSSGNHTMEVSLGRLPVTTSQELDAVVNKIIHYSSSIEALGSWRSNLLFVADDGDDNGHQWQADELSRYADTAISSMKIKKIFLGSYDQKIEASGEERSPEAEKALIKQLQKNGALIVNFTGHGGVEQLTDEKIFSNEIIDELTNIDMLPLFITATCDFGKYDEPAITSAGERLILNPNGGGIALITTARPVSSSSNFDLNKAFFRALNKGLENGETIGDIFKETKNTSFSGTGNRTFTLLGDPSMRLAFPENSISIDNIFNTDTLKAGQEVNVQGKVLDFEGNILADFNGTVDITVTDKPIELSTKEDAQNLKYTYREKKSIIYRGSASVKNGTYNINFIVPQDIEHKMGAGTIYFYAYEQDGMRDASSGLEVNIGGTFPETIVDNEGPQINTFFEDTTFKIGDVIGSNTLLLVNLSDPSGINISGRSLDNHILATIGDKSYILNDDFYSDKDDFTSGWVSFPIDGLIPGQHTLTLSASDNYNNSNSVSVDFVVIDDKKLVIDELLNYPNPVLSSTQFYFTHNRAGEALDGELTLLNNKGEKIFDIKFSTNSGQVRHKIMEWKGTTTGRSKIDPGLYYYKLTIRSRLDGAKAEKYQKLIILN